MWNQSITHIILQQRINRSITKITHEEWHSLSSVVVFCGAEIGAFVVLYLASQGAHSCLPVDFHLSSRVSCLSQIPYGVQHFPHRSLFTVVNVSINIVCESAWQCEITGNFQELFQAIFVGGLGTKQGVIEEFLQDNQVNFLGVSCEHFPLVTGGVVCVICGADVEVVGWFPFRIFHYTVAVHSNVEGILHSNLEFSSHISFPFSSFIFPMKTFDSDSHCLAAVSWELQGNTLAIEVI